MKIPPDSLVYIDESGIKEYLHREYCYAFPGIKIMGEISLRDLRFQAITLKRQI